MSARKIAQASNAKQYESGKPCRQGHLSPRFTRNGECVVCSYKRNAEWVADVENKKAIAARVRVYRAEHAERYSEIYKRYRSENAEKVKAKEAKYLRDNPEKARAKCARRRARKLGAEGSHTPEQVATLLVTQKFKCAICRTNIKGRHQEDHIVALTAGGSDYISNIQLLCKSCNSSKGCRDQIDWARTKGMLL